MIHASAVIVLDDPDDAPDVVDDSEDWKSLPSAEALNCLFNSAAFKVDRDLSLDFQRSRAE